MNTAATNPYDEDGQRAEDVSTPRTERQFKKLKRPMHATKRSKSPERLRGMHRRRRKRMGW